MLVEDRPTEVHLDGTLNCGMGPSRFVGSIRFDEHNRARLAGRQVERAEDAPPGLHATMRNGCRVHAAHLNGGWWTLGNGEVADLEIPTLRAEVRTLRGVATGQPVYRWTLSPTPIVSRLAKRPVTLDFEQVRALGLSTDELERRFVEFDDRCTWALEDGASVSLCLQQSSRRAEDELGYPRQTLVEWPYVRVAGQHGTWNPETLEAWRERANMACAAVAATLGFLEGSPVTWLDRRLDLHGDDDRTPRDRPHRVYEAHFGPMPPRHPSRRGHFLGHQLVPNLPGAIEAYRQDAATLFSAIETYLLSRTAEHPRARFLLLATSLETLRESFVQGEQSRQIINGSRFGRLSSKVRGTLREFFADEGCPEFEAMARKVPELNRPDLRTVLHAMCAHYGIDLRTMGPNGPSLDFVTYRNDLVHRGAIQNNDWQGFFGAMERLETLVELVLCKRLGLQPSEAGGLGTLRQVAP